MVNSLRLTSDFGLYDAFLGRARILHLPLVHDVGACFARWDAAGQGGVCTRTYMTTVFARRYTVTDYNRDNTNTMGNTSSSSGTLGSGRTGTHPRSAGS